MKFMDYNDIAKITGRKDTIYVSEPFELMKGVKPVFVDKHFGDIRKKFIIKIKNPSYEVFRTDWLEYDDESDEEDIRAEYNYQYGAEYNFYELVYIKLKKGNTYLFTDHYKPIFAYDPDIKETYPDDMYRSKELLEKLENTIQEHVKWIREGKYKEEVIDQIPYFMKTGTINRADYWRIITGKHKNAPFEDFQFPDRERFIKLAETEDLSDTKERIYGMSANIFFECCYAGYKKNPKEYKNVENMTPIKAYKRFADGRDEGLTEIENMNSTEAWNNWYENRPQGGHPWEVGAGGNSTHLDLFVYKERDDEGYYFIVAGRAVGRFVEAINFYLAIRDLGYPVVLRDADLFLKRLKGEETIGVVPNGTIPRYCESMFPEEEIHAFMNLYDDELEILPYVKWHEIPIPELEN